MVNLRFGAMYMTYGLFTMSKLDWLRLTDKAETLPNSYSALLASHFGHGSERKPFFGYKKALRFDCGATMHWSDDRPDMGRMWDMNAECVDELGQESAMVILRWANSYPVSLRRIDIAHDILNQETSIEMLHNQLKRGMENGECRKRTLDPTLGDSKRIIEIGARSSNLFCRTYDKGLQLNLADYKLDNWIRIEFEIKDDLANGILVAAQQHHDIPYSEWLASVWLGLFRNVFPQNSAVCGSWFDWGINPIWGNLPKKETDTRYWLETQVRSGIINYAMTQDDPVEFCRKYFFFVLEGLERRIEAKE